MVKEYFKLSNILTLAKYFGPAGFDIYNSRHWRRLKEFFGAVLLNFLLQDGFTELIPEDRELDDFKKLSSEKPVTSLPVKRGSVWILFAIEENLANLPAPFRKDGILLPFEWRTGEDVTQHSALLPQGLIELADKVKQQFGEKAEKYYLYPDSIFNDQVDFSMDGVGFSSGWGALASGLYLALNPKAMLLEWPFSSIQFDFEKGEMDAVGHLEEKITLAASFNAAELAVAPCQYKEAIKALNVAKAKYPESKKIQKLKIFMVKSAGSVEKTAANIAKCNQHNKQRLIRNICLAHAAVLLILTVAAGILYWDHYHRTYVEYYADYVDKRGMPTGIFKLNSPADIKSNHIAFLYQGRNSLFGAKSLRRVEIRNPAGHLPDLDKKISDKDLVQVLHYNENGLASIDIYDENRKKQFSKELNGEYVDFKLPSINQKSTYDMFQSSSGMRFSNTSMFSSHAKISRWKIIRNETSGFIEKIIFYATGERNALPAANAEGICGWKFERDQYGRETLRNFLDAKGNLIGLKDGTYAIKRVYNGRFLQSIHWLNFQGKSVKEIRLDINPVNGLIAERLHFINGLPGKIDDVFKVAFEYYPNGLCKKILYFDGNGNRYFKNDSCFGCEYFYYPNGKTHKIIYLDQNNKPMISSVGNAGIEFIYDEKQRIKSERALAVDCMSSATISMGISEKRFTYKKQTNDIEQVLYFDIDGKICLHKDGNAGLKAEYDDFGRQTKCTYLSEEKDKNGNYIPTLNSEGIAGWSNEYDSRGNHTKQIYFDTNGKICLHKDGTAGWQAEYDDFGRQTKAWSIGLDQKSCLNNYGFSHILKSYDYYGREVRREYRCNDKLVFNPEVGCFGYIKKYDMKTNREEIQFLNEKGKCGYDADGVSRCKRNYSAAGLLLEESYWRSTGEKAYCKQQFHRKEIRYNRYSLPEKISYYNTKNSLVKNSDNYAVEIKEYNIHGREVKNFYLNENDEKIHGFNGVHMYKMRHNRFGKLSSIECFDAHNNFTSCDDHYARAENEYNKYGFLEKATLYVAVPYAGRVTLRPYRTGIFEYDKHGRKIELIKKDISGKNYLKIIYGYDKFGRVIVEKCFNENNKAINAVDTQAHKCISEYDKYGRKVEEKWFDCKDDTQCTIKIKKISDIYGRIKEISYWRGAVRILHPKTRIHKIICEYDNYNRRTSEKYYNCAEQPTSYAENYSERRVEYYDYGKIKKDSYYFDNKPCPQNSSLSPISSIEYEYDNNLRETKIIFRDINGSKCNNRDGVAEFIYFYDESSRDPVKEIRKNCNGKVLGEGNWRTTFVIMPNPPEIKKNINVLPGDRIIAWNQFNLFCGSSRRDIIKQFESVVLSGWLNGNHLLVAREQKNGEFTIFQFFCAGRLGIHIGDQKVSNHVFNKLKTTYDEWLKNNKEQQTFEEFKSITTAVFIKGIPINLQKEYDLHNGDIVLKFNAWEYNVNEVTRITLRNEIINSKSITMVVARKINGRYRIFPIKINSSYKDSKLNFVTKKISQKELCLFFDIWSK